MSAAASSVSKHPVFQGEDVPVTPSRAPRRGLLLGSGMHVIPGQDVRRFHLCVIDLDAPHFPLTAIRMQFFGHGITPDPVHPQRLSVFEKRGKGACEVDLEKGTVTRTISPAPNHEFYGHGAYSPDGRLLYATETAMDENRTGAITIRNAETHEYIGKFPSYGVSPHDCHLIDEGNTMVITNGGGPADGTPPSVAFVDINSERLIEKLEFDTPTINAGHLDITGSGMLVVVSAQRQGLPDTAPGGITIRLANGEFCTLKEPVDIISQLQGETLSVCIHAASGIVGTTTPAGNLLAFWDINSGRLLRHYRLENPRGVELTLDGEYFVVSYGFGSPPEAVCLFSAATLERVAGYDMVSSLITGSHLFCYTFPAA